MTTKFVVLLVLVTLFEHSWANDVTYSEKEIECFAKEHVYDQASDSCQKLLSLGACKAGKWFVLEKPSSTSINDKPRIRGICADVSHGLRSNNYNLQLSTSFTNLILI